MVFETSAIAISASPPGALQWPANKLGATGGNRTRIELLGGQPPEPFGHDRMMPRRRDRPQQTTQRSARPGEARCAGFEPAISGLRGRRAHPDSSNSAGENGKRQRPDSNRHYRLDGAAC
jgi:hypothetical protein